MGYPLYQPDSESNSDSEFNSDSGSEPNFGSDSESNSDFQGSILSLFLSPILCLILSLWITWRGILVKWLFQPGIGYLCIHLCVCVSVLVYTSCVLCVCVSVCLYSGLCIHLVFCVSVCLYLCIHLVFCSILFIALAYFVLISRICVCMFLHMCDVCSSHVLCVYVCVCAVLTGCTQTIKTRRSRECKTGSQTQT